MAGKDVSPITRLVPPYLVWCGVEETCSGGFHVQMTWESGMNVFCHWLWCADMRHFEERTAVHPSAVTVSLASLLCIFGATVAYHRKLTGDGK